MNVEATKMKIALTGASGFIGRNLTSYFLLRGFSVIAMQRSKRPLIKSNLLKVINYNLELDLSKNQLAGVDYLVHAAYSAYNKSNKNADKINIKGTQNLINICKQNNIKMIFLSSYSAHQLAKSHYGSNKYKIESIVKKSGNFIVRLGLVASRSEGLFNTIASMVEKLRVIPLIGGGIQKIHLIDIERLCLSIENLFSYSGPERVFNLASVDTITMGMLYKIICKSNKRLVIFLTLPYFIAEIIIRIGELIKLNLPVNQENLLGLKACKSFPSKKSLKDLGLQNFTSKDVMTKLGYKVD